MVVHRIVRKRSESDRKSETKKDGRRVKSTIAGPSGRLKDMTVTASDHRPKDQGRIGRGNDTRKQVDMSRLYHCQAKIGGALPTSPTLSRTRAQWDLTMRRILTDNLSQNDTWTMVTNTCEASSWRMNGGRSKRGVGWQTPRRTANGCQQAAVSPENANPGCGVMLAVLSFATRLMCCKK